MSLWIGSEKARKRDDIDVIEAVNASEAGVGAAIVTASANADGGMKTRIGEADMAAAKGTTERRSWKIRLS
jgi:glutamate 5-kinase